MRHVGRCAEKRFLLTLSQGSELSLEPNANPAAKTCQEAIFTQGIPPAAFEVSDMQGDYARLVKHGVAFTREPTRTGPVTIAIISDTCGNPIQLYQLI